MEGKYVKQKKTVELLPFFFLSSYWSIDLALRESSIQMALCFFHILSSETQSPTTLCSLKSYFPPPQENAQIICRAFLLSRALFLPLSNKLFAISPYCFKRAESYKSLFKNSKETLL